MSSEGGLREPEELFAQLVAGVQDYAVFLLDRQGNVLTWNAGAERLKGYRAEDIIGKHFSAFYPDDTASSGWPAHELDVAAATGRFEDEGWRVRKDGTRFWANVVLTALRDEGGKTRGFLKITRDLTDRKQAEEKLRRSEERFRLMVESVKDYAIFMLDPEGRVATWNAGAERLKGYRAEDIIGQHFSTFYPREALERGWPDEELRYTLRDGRFEDEGWRVRKDGTRFWANVVITALWDADGALQGFAKVTRDLTERRAAEESARRAVREEAARQAAEELAKEVARQREHLRATLASIGDAVIVTDDGGAVSFMNSVAVALTGWEPRDAIGRPCEDVFRIVNEETRQTVESPVARVLREGAVVGLANHTVLLTRDGREVPIDDSGAPILGERGAVAGVVLVFRDVTEVRRAAEAQLRLAAIVESSDDAIIGQTLDGTITSWNRGAERLYGYTAGEIVGRPIALLAPPDRAAEVGQLLDRVRRGEPVEHFETQRVRRDGRRVDVSLTVSPIRNAMGKVVGASKIARDITARKEEDRRKTEFLALLAHELRNPLAPLSNALQVIRAAGDDRAAVERTRAVMERQLRHLTRLVDDLLDVNRISLGKLHLHRERLSLRTMVTEALGVCRAAVEQHGRELVVDVSDGSVEVDGDRTRLAQVVCNLLTNATKYSDPGTRIWLTARREGGEAVVSVRDEGVGIPADMLTRVFEMFTQVGRTLEKSQGGLGVGLGIVKRLVELHGGTVEALSAGVGRGSEFVVRLPAATPVEVHEPPEPKEQSPAASGRRILVVDDNSDSADSLGQLLELLGHEVRVAYDGEAGAAEAESFRPDVVLMDIGMPKLDGYAAARRIRGQPWGKGIVLVALTGWGQDSDRRQSEEAGFDAHLVKPVGLPDLERVLSAGRT